MAKKKKDKTAELPHMNGPGVAPLKLPELDKAIARYEKKKQAWIETSPGVNDAKRDLRALMHEHRAELPTNDDGQPFYRHDGVDYILKESILRREADDGESREEL